MTRNIDFLVCGLPRSGTTALAKYISATKEMHCFIEVFEATKDHRRLDVPAAFIEGLRERAERQPTRYYQKEYQTAVSAIRKKGDDLSLFGHKRPNYYHYIHRVLEQSGFPKVIVSYRDMESVAKSFLSRAANPSDTWHKGRVGMFAAAEAMLFILALAGLKRADVLVVPNRLVLADWSAALSGISAFLQPGLSVTIDHSEVQELRKRKESIASKTRWNLDNVDHELMDMAYHDELDGMFDREEVFVFEEIQPNLVELARCLPKDPIRIVKEAAQRHGNPEAIRYFNEGWANRAKSSFEGLRLKLVEQGVLQP